MFLSMPIRAACLIRKVLRGNTSRQWESFVIAARPRPRGTSRHISAHRGTIISESPHAGQSSTCEARSAHLGTSRCISESRPVIDRRVSVYEDASDRW